MSGLRSGVRSALLAAAGIAASLLTAIAGPAHMAAAATDPTEEIFLRPANGVFAIEGHGWGHGHGMSQWGAEGAATHGVSYDKILAAYYPNTTLSPAVTGNMRVLLEQDDDNDLQVMPSKGLTVTDTASKATLTLPTGSSYDRWRAKVSGSKLLLQSLDGSTWTTMPIGTATSFTGPLVFSSQDQTRRVVFPDGSMRDYRGTLSGVVTGTGDMISVATMGIEDYLRGVVPRESPSSWAADALKAQAVAARTYSAYKRAHAAAGAPYDICDSTTCQVFGGTRLIQGSTTTELETSATNAAIDATRSQALLYNGQPAFTEFSSSNGGWSTDGNQPYLTAHADPWDGLAFDDTTSNVHHWQATLKVSDIEARYKSQGLAHFERMRIESRDGNGDWGGRVLDVELDGTDSTGAPITVDATGGGIYLSHPWPTYSDGLRSNWWRVIPSYDAVIRSVTGNRSLVAGSSSDLTIALKNTGTSPWPGSSVHLIVATPRGGADPLVGGSRTPGVFEGTTTSASATQVQPGETGLFGIHLDSSGQQNGSYTEQWITQIGSATPFGPTVKAGVTIAAPIFSGQLAAPPSGAPAQGSAPPVVDSHGNVIVVRNASTQVTLKIRNTGNVTWPANGPVTLATINPSLRSSASAGSTWVSASRATRLQGRFGAPGQPVGPGDVGVFVFTIYGNGHSASVSKESFQPLWEGRHWIDGAGTTLTIIRTDPHNARQAALESASPTSLHLTNAPNGTASIDVRLRNLGNAAWSLSGSDAIGTADGKASLFSTSTWESKSIGPTLYANASRPGQQAVYPGEIGEWRVPISAFRVAAGSYQQALRATTGSQFYGPVLTASISVASASFKAALSGVTNGLQVPRSASSTVTLDVTNTGTADWPLGGPVRSAAYAKGGSPSAGSNWINVSRPSSLLQNVSDPHATVVHPGQVGRFAIVLWGNNRAPGSYSEQFGVGWEGWSDAGLRVTVSYTIH